MKIPKLSYIEFLNLPDQERMELQEIILVSSLFDVDCKTWTWGKVKDVQAMLDDEITYKTIFDIAKLESPKLKEQTDFHIILNLFFAIQKSITEIGLIETTALASQLTNKEIGAAAEVGGFERFGSLPQTLKLVQLLGCDIEKVNVTSWELCFSALVYDKTANEFNKKVLTT